MIPRPFPNQLARGNAGKNVLHETYTEKFVVPVRRVLRILLPFCWKRAAGWHM